MAMDAKLTTKDIGGVQKPVFQLEFTNGTLEQLEDLAQFLEKRGLSLPKNDDTARFKEVIRLGISWLETLKAKESEEPDTQ